MGDFYFRTRVPSFACTHAEVRGARLCQQSSDAPLRARTSRSTTLLQTIYLSSSKVALYGFWAARVAVAQSLFFLLTRAMRFPVLERSRGALWTNAP